MYSSLLSHNVTPVVESPTTNDPRDHFSIPIHRIADHNVENDAKVMLFDIKFLVICDRLMEYDMHVIVGITDHS